ncbi:MAG: DNA-processing protein DprA [Thermodesulfovibrionales bacterium]
MAGADPHLAALAAIPALGPLSVSRLVSAFGSAEAVFGARSEELARVPGVDRKRAGAIREFRVEEFLRGLERVRGEGVRVVGRGSEGYPAALEALESAPPVLYMKGAPAREDMFSIAVVGSREPSPYGRQVTWKMASDLAGTGFTVTSGLARGIDTAAHRGAIEAGGRSMAVLGSGIDVPYPPENRGLMEKVAASGCVMTEFPPGTRPYKSNFPRRNRIISALSLGVLVVEAAPGSGSLITARHALEQGKEVFAIPGNINSRLSSGTNELIRDGARVVTRAADIVEELAPVLRGFIKSKERKQVEVTGDEKALCDIMSEEPVHVDVLSRQSGMPPSRTLAVLLGLELKGVVRQIEGKKFHLV